MSVPQHVLSDQLSEVIGNRRVTSAVFTTFNFDPGFFELHVLPLLFPNEKFSEAEKVRLLQLEDCLRSLRNLAVYYDANALAQDGESPKLGYDRIDVHWKRGVFHPKMILLLAQDDEFDGREFLIACVQSANITRAGWWENIECAHIEVAEDKRLAEHPCSFRNDLMAILGRIRRSLPNEHHGALDEIHQFVRYRTNPTPNEQMDNNDVSGTRLYSGANQLNFADWLNAEAVIPRGWNLEVVSPYFDRNNANALDQLIKATEPKQTRVFLPQSEDGTALVSDTVYNQVKSIAGVSWARLPEGFTQRKGAVTENLAPRFIHAKVYRFWRKQKADLIVVGSINCTKPAHSEANQGNLEAGFLLSASNQKLRPVWWLENLVVESIRFVETTPEETDGNDHALFDVFVKYDWARHEVAVRLEGKLSFPIAFLNSTENVLFSLDSIGESELHVCSQIAADKVRDAIQASSFLNVQCKDVTWRVLIREASFSHRPSLLTELTPDEILKYWSLLSAEQRTAFLERRMFESVEGLAKPTETLIDTTESVFHRFSGIFHAFGHLYRHLCESLDAERISDAECRLLGAKYDSLPELLRKVVDQDESDPLFVYITFLTAKQLRVELGKKYEWFFNHRTDMIEELDHLIAQGLERRSQIELDGDDDAAESFFNWFETMFLTEFNA